MVAVGIVFLLFALAIIYNIFATIRAFVKWYFGDYINKYLLIAKIDPVYKEPLKEHLVYYQNLNENDKSISFQIIA